MGCKSMKNIKERAGNSLQALLKLEFWQRQKLQEALAINVDRVKPKYFDPLVAERSFGSEKLDRAFALDDLQPQKVAR